jgi:hypothetical protein
MREVGKMREVGESSRSNFVKGYEYRDINDLNNHINFMKKFQNKIYVDNAVQYIPKDCQDQLKHLVTYDYLEHQRNPIK